ncbi:MAG TPA: HIT domain-containing protein [Ktedonobacteraceae bacterium]|jgi:diadenosine tetraphosphate (Ap4A) HIT family hydrolase|nr:HIT domain-containing protein [Ktedonobacteraceae bacterium]
MQREDNAASSAAREQMPCPFCQDDILAQYLLKETAHFRLITDHAPLIEGHVLIIPKEHYTCYGDVPGTLDAEFLALKDEVRTFFAEYYDVPVYWEHGIFHQTVFHAHLHCFPFGDIHYDLDTALHAEIIHTQTDLRRWHAAHGHYFFLEDSTHAMLFPPDAERYQFIIQKVLWANAAPHFKNTGWRSPQQRYEVGKPLVQATIAKWRTFEQQGAKHVS